MTNTRLPSTAAVCRMGTFNEWDQMFLPLLRSMAKKSPLRSPMNAFPSATVGEADRLPHSYDFFILPVSNSST